MKKENLTIGCFYKNHINNYEFKNGEMVLTVEEIFYKEFLKTLFDDEVFYDGLMNLLDGMGVEEIGVEKNEDGKFTFYVYSYLINKDYRLVKNFRELKNKYNFKEIIFDEDEYQVTFKF